MRSGSFDVLVIGGGITGAGVALDAAARGLRVALVERGDLACATSGHSSRLVHGGLRYLQKGELGLVVESLAERQRLLANAAHLVTPLEFVIPLLASKGKMDTAVTRAYRGILRSYDLAGGRRIGEHHRMASVAEVTSHLGFLRTERLMAGLVYWDARTDDARLTLTVARTAAAHGAVVVTYAEVTHLLKDRWGSLNGARITVDGCPEPLEVRAKVLVNATGVWSDRLEALAGGSGGIEAPMPGARLGVPARSTGRPGLVEVGLAGLARRVGLSTMTAVARAATASGLAAKVGLAAHPNLARRGGRGRLAALAERRGPVRRRPATAGSVSLPRPAELRPRLRPAKGVHITVPASRLPCDVAAVLPGPGDKRTIFVIPWGTHVYVGTTDTDYRGSLEEPRASADDVDYLLRAINASAVDPLSASDVTGVWAGLRPLLASGGDSASTRTADLSRHHRVSVAPGGLVTVTGGKLTTYRRMAADTVDVVARHCCADGLTRRLRRSPTAALRLWGSAGLADLRQPGAAARLGTDQATLDHLVSRYGGEAPAVLELVTERPELGLRMVEGLDYLAAEAVYAARFEMAHTLLDILNRRTNAMQRDRLATARAAPDVAALIAPELGWDQAETRRQVAQVLAMVTRDGERAGLALPARIEAR